MGQRNGEQRGRVWEKNLTFTLLLYSDLIFKHENTLSNIKKNSKSLPFLYTKNVLSEKEIKITIPFSFIKNKMFRNKLNQAGESLVQ